MKRFLIVAVVMCFGFTGVHAQYSHDKYDNHDRRGGYHDNYDRGSGRAYNVNVLQREALETIERNARNGRLSRGETHMLMRQYKRIAQTEQKFSAHGRLSGKEARILTDNLEGLIEQTHRLSRHGDNWARGDRGRY